MGRRDAGRAADLGLKTGDVLLKAGGKDLTEPQDLISALAEAKSAGRKSALVLFRHGKTEAFLAVPVTQVIYAGAMASAMVLRQVDWRGVEYQVAGPRGIRLLEYRPFVAESADNSDSTDRVTSL